MKENCLAVPHPAVSDCAADQARDVDRAGDGAVIGCFDPAQRDGREAPCPAIRFAFPGRIDPHAVRMLWLERLLRDQADQAKLSERRCRMLRIRKEKLYGVALGIGQLRE